MPQRLQLKRTKGWRLPEGAISVARPGRWGNPIRVGAWAKVGAGRGSPGWCWVEAREGYQDSSYTKIEDQAQAVAMFRLYRERYPLTEPELAELRGRDLACWCKPGTPCHADVLIELANP